MARLTDAVLGDKGYGKGAQAPMLNLLHGAQGGSLTNVAEYISNAPYVSCNLIARLIEAPRGFRDLPDPDRWVEALKTLVELHPRVIDGLKMGIEGDFSEIAFGGAGEVQQTIKNATRQRSEPVFTYDEKYGRPIWNFFNGWFRNLIMDPETKYPAVVSNNIAGLTDLLPDYRAATMLFFEPDPTHTKVMKAWLITNMMPKADGETDGKRDLTAEGETQEHQIGFTGIQQVGVGVNQFAQKILDSMNLTGLNPNLKPAFINAITADVKAGASGFAETLSAASKAAIRT
jgi:hypothetical protein